MAARLASQSGIMFIIRMFGAGFIFLAQAAITRLWGPDVLGEYLVVIAATNIIGVVLPLGFETVGSYFAAEYRIKGEGRLLRGFMLRAYGHIAVLLLLLVVTGPLVLPMLGTPGQVLLEHWWQVCLLTLGNALLLVSSQLLIGFKRPFASFFPDIMARPILILASVLAVWLIFTADDHLDLVVWLVAGAYLLTGLLQAIYCIKVAREVPLEASPRPGESRRWWRFALPWIVVVLATDFFFDLDLMLLAGFMEKHELAIFGVCARLFVLVSFGLTAVYALTLPDIFESGVKGGSGAFLKKVGDTNIAAAGVALVLVVSLAVGGPVALLLFGTEFLVGAVPLIILSLGLIVRALMGPAALALSMHDRPHTALPAVAAGVATLVVLNLILVPAAGIMGAAIAAMVAQSAWSIAMWITVLRVVKTDVSIFPRLRELLHAHRAAAAARN